MDADTDATAQPPQPDQPSRWGVRVFAAIGVAAVVLALVSFPWRGCRSRATVLWLIASLLAIVAAIGCLVYRRRLTRLLVVSTIVCNVALFVGWMSLFSNTDRYDRTLAEELDAYTGPSTAGGGVDPGFLPDYLRDWGMSDDDVDCIMSAVEGIDDPDVGVAYEEIKAAVDDCDIDAASLHQCFNAVAASADKQMLATGETPRGTPCDVARTESRSA
jgi:hypothetical protein